MIKYSGIGDQMPNGISDQVLRNTQIGYTMSPVEKDKPVTICYQLKITSYTFNCKKPLTIIRGQILNDPVIILHNHNFPNLIHDY